MTQALRPIPLLLIAIGGCAPASRSEGPLAPSPWNRPAAPAATASPAPAPAAAPSDPADAWRPDWWSDTPQRDDGLVVVCAMAEDADLLLARAAALRAAEESFARETSRLPGQPLTLTDSIRLGDGRFRAFVRLQAVPR